MTALAPTLQAFFTERLIRQRQASPNTIASYRDTFRLLLSFAEQQTSTKPSQLDLADLDAELIGAFLDHLEHERLNSTATRNARLAAIRSLFGYAAHQHPEHAKDNRRVPAQRRDRRAALRARPIPLDRASRPRAAANDDPDRPARLRVDRP
jgi:integrase/recombinase XerD